MVTPAAKRQAVAHLCSSFEVSQRRACEVIRADRPSVRYLVCGPMTLPSDPGCVNWRRFGGVLAINVFFSCSEAKASGSITRS